jgi:hypothetical protein
LTQTQTYSFKPERPLLADLARMRRAALTRNERLEPALIEPFRAP